MAVEPQSMTSREREPGRRAPGGNETRAQAPTATILIAAVADKPSLRGVLEIVRRQADVAGAEVLLVVNGPPSGLMAESREALELLCDRLLFEPRQGKSFALNHGLAAARGEVIVFTDDDTRPQPGWLPAILEVLTDPERDADLVGVGGPVIPIFEPEVPDWFRQIVESRPSHYLGPRHDYGSEPSEYPIGRSPVGGVPLGANFAVRREAVDGLRYPTELGPSPITRLRGGEDTVLERQLLARGGRLRYEPRAVVHHPVSAQRASLEFALEACRAHGRESIFVRRRLGLQTPTRFHLLRKLVKRRLRGWRQQDRDERQAAEHALRLAELRGMLDGLS